MTVATTTNRVSYTGNGSTTAFSVTFPFYDNTDLQVIERVIATGVETTKTLITHYTVTGGSGSTGTVTAVTAPASTVQWTIKRVLPRTQGTDLTPNDPFPANSVEQVFDRAVMLIQEIEEITSRCLRFPATDSTSLTSQLSSAVARASKYLAFDSNGNVTLTSGTDGSQIISSAMEAVVGALTLALARAAMLVPGLGDNNTYTGSQTISGDVSFGAAVATPGDISPSITADQNDWSPTGLSGASAIRLTTDAARTITGMAGGADGRYMAIHNVGSNNAILANEDTGSTTAANRFALPYDKITILPSQVVTLRYDATSSRWRLLSAPVYEHTLIYEDQKSNGTVGGAATTGLWTKHVLNTEVLDTGGHGAVAGDVLTLQAGTYEVFTETTVGILVGGFRTKLKNTSDTLDHALSLTGGGGGTTTKSANYVVTGRDRFTIAAAKNYELQYFAEVSNGTTDLGQHDNVAAGVETYARITLRKIA